MTFHQMIICLVFSVLLVLSSVQSNNSSQCNRSCGVAKKRQKVPYPFGFDDGCGIKLNCIRGNIQIGDFLVENVTSDNIIISLPAKCNRSIEELSQLFGRNYAMTRRNGLLLQNCSSPIGDCAILNFMSKSHFPGFVRCGSSRENKSCFSGGINGGADFLNFGTVKENGNCRILFSSIAVDLNENGNNSDSTSGSSSVEMNFEKVELGWWLEGFCNRSTCHPNAKCTKVLNGNMKGFRCKCNPGYAGDGFTGDGSKGCRKGSCNASRYMSGECGGTRIGILITGIVAGASLVVILALVCYCIKRHSKSLKSQLSAKRLLCEATGRTSFPFYPYKEIEKATNSFSENQRLGTGAYGTVYAGKLHNDEWVAIKKIRHRDRDSIEQVMNEIKLLSSVSHPNLVRLLGCCIENDEQILVYEYMPNGTLSQHLQRERGSVLPWTIRLTIATETAHAIAHLHSAMNPPIYHRDIKSSNILLDYNFNSKVADFGLSRFGMTDDSHVSTAPQGTPGYVDPQYHQNFHLSDKSDVYSFGVVLVEIITAMKVVDFSRTHSEINLAALAIDRIGKGRVDEIIDPFLEPNRDAWTLCSVHKVAELAFRCLSFHRDMRPSMIEVADELDQIKLSGWAPLDENICMGSSVASSCSSPYLGSENSLNTMTNKKSGIGSRRLVVSQRAGVVLPTMEEAKDNSPVSVQDPWLSEQSSPSTNSLLGNRVH
ncbi:wall-associated receptor kinase-like 14 [Olea europaea subsp. europaea]|uniref:Wall-associated receptor kinase-like 14 n=1 Tax=Olea europaea subsp. europaea TaxID=158383 RepID=A0A8S0QXE8_OLEEU|nr:wall-associated receptor kinase-like 14 [Olea europaea subsp. europaea]